MVRRHAFRYRYQTPAERTLLDELRALVMARKNRLLPCVQATGWTTTSPSLHCPPTGPLLSCTHEPGLCALSARGGNAEETRAMTSGGKTQAPAALPSEASLTVLGDVGLVGPLGHLGPTAPQQRLLMSMLIAHRRRPVSHDALAGLLWGENPPRTATGALHALVAKWRAALEPDAEPRDRTRVLCSTPGGYRLDVADDMVDEGRFRRLSAAGTKALDRGDAIRARRVLASALREWRGTPFAEFADHPALSTASAALTESVQCTRVSYLQARTLLGERGEISAEIETLIRDDPYRERLWELLIHALHSDGRRAAALDAYRRCRETFADDLGIEPGPRLRELHGRVLAEGLRPPTSARSRIRAASRPSRRIPSTSFIGRERERADLIVAIEKAIPVTVTGPGGVGKTRLALETAVELDHRYDLGAVVVDLREARPSEDIAALVLDELAQPSGRQPAGTTLAAFLADRSALLILDNADRAAPGVSELARMLRTSGPRVRLLVTSRRPLGVDGELVFPLDTLSCAGRGSPAVRMFLDRAAASAPGPAFDPARVASVCRDFDGLPIAIELAAARLGSVGLDELPALALDPLPADADVLLVNPSAHRTLRGVVDWSVGLLSAPDRALLRRLSVFAGGFTAEAASSVCDYDGHARIDDALWGLAQRSLIAADPHLDGPRFHMLQVIRADGLARLFEHGELPRFRARHRAWCAGLDVSDFASELDNVRTAMRTAIDSGETHAASRLACRIAPLYLAVGRPDEARAWLAATARATAALSRLQDELLVAEVPSRHETAERSAAS